MRPVGAFRIPASHPSLPGHFPGRPLTPGVVLLDAAFALILAQYPGQAVTGLPAVKFTRPVLPGEQVDVSCAASPGGEGVRLAFACAVAGQDVLRGSMTLGVRGAAA